MSIHPELSYDRDISQVSGIQFTLQTPEEIVEHSVCEITRTDTYSGTEPVIGGLFDARMGVVSAGARCKTCFQTYTYCPGHFAHLKLAMPCYWLPFFDTCRKIIKCICINCSKLLISPETLLKEHVITKKLSNHKRFDNIEKYITKSKISSCPHCGSEIAEKILKSLDKFVLTLTFKAQDEEESRIHDLHADEALVIFNNIPEEDMEILGFHNNYNPPRAMIMTVMPIPPPSMRPSVRFDTGQRSEDDLTHQLSNIIKANKLLADKIKRVEEGGAGTASREEINRRLHSLQHALFVYVDNNNPNIPSVKQRMGGRPLKTLLERLKGKEGRFRNHLMGKRVDVSARSVITPDPNIGINELGVPYKIAMNLTVPETVNKYNIEELDKYVKNGPNIYPGAKYVKHTDKNITVIIREKNQRKLEIAIGDVVYRHMKNGDVVLFNRQPSLHRMSMMAHKVRIMDYNTFRLNVCVTPCYNADFDG